MNHALDPEYSEAIEDLMAEGKTQRVIAATLGIAQSTVSKYQNRARVIPPAQEWGLGAAKLVAPATTESAETVAFIPDLHVDFHDEAMVASSVNLVRALQPHRVVLLGDVNDFFQLSRFNKGLDRLDTLQGEINLANRVRHQYRQAAPNAVMDECEGNHDSRLRTYVQFNARALYSLDALKPENLHAWKANEITPHGDNGFRLREEFLVKHGTIVRSEAGATAKAEFMAAGISGISGHTHRLAPYIKEGYVQREWWEAGCLCRLDPDYVKGSVPNWRNGMLVGQFSTKSGAFAIEPVTRFENKLMYGGRLY